MSIETLRVIPSGDIALLHGMWLLTGTGQDGNPLELAGRKHRDRAATDRWKLAVRWSITRIGDA